MVASAAEPPTMILLARFVDLDTSAVFITVLSNCLRAKAFDPEPHRTRLVIEKPKHARV